MANTILKYQKAFNSIIQRLKDDDSVLAVMVFGSMVTGDLWEESDIDLFVVIDDDKQDFKNIYTLEKDIPIHIKLISKLKFINSQTKELKGGFIHRVFVSSKLVFSKDMDITNRYDAGRYYPDLDREIWNLIYLGKLLKDIGICKKYYCNNRLYTAYNFAVNCIEVFSKLKINSSGYMVSKDVLTSNININEEFKYYVDKMFFNKDDVNKNIEQVIKFIEQDIEDNLQKYTSFLIQYIKEKDEFLSSEDIKSDKIFKEYNINMEDILFKLSKKNLIKKQSREYKSKNRNILFNENVYFI